MLVSVSDIRTTHRASQRATDVHRNIHAATTSHGLDRERGKERFFPRELKAEKNHTRRLWWKGR